MKRIFLAVLLSSAFFFFSQPSLAHADFRLFTPSTTVLNNTDVSFTLSGLNQCINNNVDSFVLHVKYNNQCDIKSGCKQTKTTFKFKQDPYTFTSKIDTGSTSRQTVDVWASANNCGQTMMDPNTGFSIPVESVSNTVKITTTSQSDINMIRPILTIEPNPPYINEQATFKGTNFHESGCPDGRAAQVEWKNIDDVGGDQFKMVPVDISNNSIALKVSFNNGSKKEAWVRCQPQNETKFAESLHTTFQPVDRKGVQTSLTPSPPPPSPPEPPCKDKAYGNLDAATYNCTSLNTAIGSIDTNPASLINNLFKIILGLAGGIAVIIIIMAGYKIMASQGNPEAIKGARESLTSAIVGLLFIIFSLVILQTIGVDILRIPGFKP